MKWWLGFVMVVLLSFGSSVSTSYACSSPVGTLNRSVESAERIVRARVVDVDDFEQNAIIHVETSYKGNGQDYYVLVARNMPSVNIGIFVGRYGGGDCVYGGPRLQHGDVGYFLLWRELLGSMSIVSLVFNRLTIRNVFILMPIMNMDGMILQLMNWSLWRY